MTARTAKTEPARTYNPARRTLRLTDGRSDETYRVEPIRNGGTLLGVRLHKRSTGERHDVDVIDHRCDCLGCEQHGRCKHLTAIRDLIALEMIAR